MLAFAVKWTKLRQFEVGVMNPRSIQLVALLLLILTSPALAGITVTSYQTVAQANAYAPTSQSQYFERQALVNVSPALAHVSGDWMGTNVGGSVNTWHYVGAAQVATATTFDADQLTVTAGGSFAYDITTTLGFVDPSSASIFSPGAAANYEGFFTTDVPVTYAMTGQLNQRGRVQLNSVAGGVGIVFNQSNPTPTPVEVNLTGTIPAGQYRVLITAGLGAPSLPNGVNHYAASGSYENVFFTVRVPEPDAFAGALTMNVTILRRRKWCARAR